MSSRWVVRIVGILMLLGFLLIFAHMQRRLIEMQKMRKPPATTTSTTSTQ